MSVFGLTPVPEAPIRVFETQQHIVLPQSYASFLQHVGVGCPVPNCHLNGAHECYFLALIFDPREERMVEQCFAFPSPADCGFLPIGTNAGGDYFLLSLVTGAVYYWDHEQHDEVVASQELIWLAPSLPALVDSLTSYPSDSPEEHGAA